MTRVALSHATTYRYDRPVGLGPQRIRLRPAAHARAAIEHYDLTVAPADHRLHWQQDPFNNWLARVTFAEPVDVLSVHVDLVADLRPVNPFDFLVEPYAAEQPFTYPDELRADLAPFLAQDPMSPRLDAMAARFPGGGDTVRFLTGLNAAVREEVAYLRRLEPGTQTPEATLARGAGSCRDSAWLLVQLLRRLGFAARFVSGYSIQLADGAEVAADTADLHAWAEAYLPGAGWIGLDATSGLMAGAGHIPLAATPHYRSAAPVDGTVYGPGQASIGFSLDVRRLDPAEAAAA